MWNLWFLIGGEIIRWVTSDVNRIFFSYPARREGLRVAAEHKCIMICGGKVSC